MLSFKQFISEQILRSGLPHLHDLTHEQVGALVKGNSFSGVTTPKTDGAAGEVGYGKNPDTGEEGVYTRSARSGNVWNAGDYSAYTRNKRGEDADTTISDQYDAMHKHLQNNSALVDYLKSRYKEGKPSSIKGEFFLRGLGKPTEKGIQFVGTSYNPDAMGKHGMFIMHHQLEGNETHEPETISRLGDSNVTFDHDKAEGNRFDIDTSKEREAYANINSSVLKSRKKADQEAKAAENEKLSAVKSSLEQKLGEHASKVKPRPWEVEGESEGNVFHPDDKTAPRTKITSAAFREFKAKQRGVK